MVANAANYTELSDDQNHVAEYHNYMREYVRYVGWEASFEERKDMAGRVAEHREAAEALIADGDDPFVAACNVVQDFNDLIKEYTDAGGPDLEPDALE